MTDRYDHQERGLAALDQAEDHLLAAESLENDEASVTIAAAQAWATAALAHYTAMAAFIAEDA